MEIGFAFSKPLGTARDVLQAVEKRGSGGFLPLFVTEII
jgi:hypothetical protein